MNLRNYLRAVALGLIFIIASTYSRRLGDSLVLTRMDEVEQYAMKGLWRIFRGWTTIFSEAG